MSRKERADAPGGNPSDPRWQPLRNEIKKLAKQKGKQPPEKTKAWKALGLQGPIGSLVVSKSWESRFAYRANEGWTTGKIAFEFWDQCRTYGIEMPEEFQLAIVSVIQAEGIPFDFRMAEGRVIASTSKGDNSTPSASASEEDHPNGPNNFEAGQEKCLDVIQEDG